MYGAPTYKQGPDMFQAAYAHPSPTYQNANPSGAMYTTDTPNTYRTTVNADSPTSYTPSNNAGHSSTYTGNQYDNAAATHYDVSAPPQASIRQTYHPSPSVFLDSNRQAGPIVQNTALIIPLVQETFKTLTGKDLPANINITVSDAPTLSRIYNETGSKWSSGIQGFSFNQWGQGQSRVYAKEAPLDELMLTLGHEIGHILSPTLPNPRDEEAKAFAFSSAWADTIRTNNIGNIAGNFRMNPAQNGIHDVACAFVQKLINAGAQATEIFMQLAKRTVSIAEQLELIHL